MTPHFVRVRPNWTVAQALDHIRQYGTDSETMSLIYVIDENGKLIDDLRIRQILLASPETQISDLMDSTFRSSQSNGRPGSGSRGIPGGRHERICPSPIRKVC